MRLSEGIPGKTCVNPQAHDLKLSRTNLYKNEKVQNFQKNPRAHKNKIGTSPPPKTQNTPPPLKGGILWTWLFPAERTHFSRRP